MPRIVRELDTEAGNGNQFAWDAFPPNNEEEAALLQHQPYPLLAPAQAYRLRPYAPVSPYSYRPAPQQLQPMTTGGGQPQPQQQAPAAAVGLFGGSADDETFFSTMCGVLLCMLLLLFLAFVLSYPAMGYYSQPQGNDAWRARPPTAWAYGP